LLVVVCAQKNFAGSSIAARVHRRRRARRARNPPFIHHALMWGYLLCPAHRRQPRRSHCRSRCETGTTAVPREL